jgi:hypothetical protein
MAPKKVSRSKKQALAAKATVSPAEKALAALSPEDYKYVIVHAYNAVHMRMRMSVDELTDSIGEFVKNFDMQRALDFLEEKKAIEKMKTDKVSPYATSMTIFKLKDESSKHPGAGYDIVIPNLNLVYESLCLCQGVSVPIENIATMGRIGKKDTRDALIQLHRLKLVGKVSATCVQRHTEEQVQQHEALRESMRQYATKPATDDEEEGEDGDEDTKSIISSAGVVVVAAAKNEPVKGEEEEPEESESEEEEEEEPEKKEDKPATSMESPKSDPFRSPTFGTYLYGEMKQLSEEKEVVKEKSTATAQSTPRQKTKILPNSPVVDLTSEDSEEEEDYREEEEEEDDEDMDEEDDDEVQIVEVEKPTKRPSPMSCPPPKRIEISAQ